MDKDPVILSNKLFNSEFVISSRREVVQLFQTGAWIFARNRRILDLTGCVEDKMTQREWPDAAR
jgi:hypothetical protein